MSVNIKLSDQVKSLLNPCEDFTIAQDIPGVSGYMMTLRTHLYVHLKYTAKTLFRPHSYYVAASLTALPNIGFMEAWLENAREATIKGINKGDFTDEKLVGGEWQSWHRKFNQWFYYDRPKQLIFGKVEEVHNEK